MRYYFKTITLLLCFFTLNTSLSAQSDEYGIASYYDDSFQGSKTASGEAYDKVKYTGAHKKLPFGTIVKVTRLDNKESVKVRINDRGPYIKGRIVELSRKAAEKINLVNDGVAKVKVEIIGNGAVPEDFSNVENPTTKPIIIPETSPRSSNPDKLETTVKKTPSKVNQPSPATNTASAKTKKKTSPPPPTTTTKKKSSAPPAKSIAPMETATRVRSGNFNMYDLYKVQILRPERTGYGVQVASLTNYANVMKQVAELQEKWFKNILISVEKGKGNEPIYKVLLGPFPDRETAKSYEKDLKKKKKIDGFIVELESIKY